MISEAKISDLKHKARKDGERDDENVHVRQKTREMGSLETSFETSSRMEDFGLADSDGSAETELQLHASRHLRKLAFSTSPGMAGCRMADMTARWVKLQRSDGIDWDVIGGFHH